MRGKIAGLILTAGLTGLLSACGPSRTVQASPAVTSAACPLLILAANSTTCTWVRVDSSSTERMLECRIGPNLKFRTDTSGIGQG